MLTRTDQPQGECCTGAAHRNRWATPALRWALLYCLPVLSLLVGPLAHAGVKVGLVYAVFNSSVASDVKSKLAAMKMFDTVDGIDAGVSTPSMATLNAYDALLIFSDQRNFNDGSTLGNTLATYIETRGGVVVMVPYVNSPGALTGRFSTDYNLMSATSPNFTLGLSLDKVMVMSPIFTGVSTITTSGNECYTVSSVSLAHMGQTVADWSNTAPLAITGTINGHPRVDINMWAASTDAGFPGCWDPGSDAAKLIANSLVYVSNPLQATPGTVDFGDVPVGLSTSPQTVQVTNTGATSITINSGDVAPSGEFTVSLDGGAAFPITLSAGSSFSFDVTFAPSASGARSATYTLTPMGSPPLAVGFTGNGLGPRFATSPTQVDFGGSKSGMPPPGQTLTVTNSGGGQLRLKSFMLTDATNFGLDNVPTSGHILSAGASSSVTVKFTPASKGQFMAQLQVTYDLVGSMDNVTSSINIRGSSGDPMISVDAGGISLPPVRVGKDGPPGYVTVTNKGFADLTISTVMFTGADPMDFVVDSKPPLTVTANGGTMNVMVHFSPKMQGMRSADLHIKSDDPLTPDVSVPFDSIGTVANFAISPMMLDFTNGGMKVQQTGTCSAAQNVTVSNSGTDSLTILSVSFTGTGAADFKQPIMGTKTVPGNGGMVAIPVQFCPVDIGMITANLVVATDLMPGHMVMIPLNGTASGPKVSASPGMIDFGPVYIKTTTMPQTITLSNTGDQDLVFGSPAINPNGSPFAVMNLPKMGDTLKPGATLALMVTASPTMSVQSDGELDIPVNDQIVPGAVLKIPLHVTGIQANIMVQPKVLMFPNTSVGLKSQSQSVQVTNTGKADLTNIMFTVAGPGNAVNDFVVTGTKPTKLSAGQSATVQLVFAPSVAGPRSATLRIDATGLAVTEQVMLSGTGQMLMVTCTPDTKDFGMVQVGQMAMGQFLCTNMDSNPLDISAAFEDAQTEWTVMTDTTTIPASSAGNPGTLQVNVVFHPTSPGDKSTSLDIKGKDSGILVMSLGVNGIGVAPPMMQPPPSGCSCNVGGTRTAAPGGGAVVLLVGLGLVLLRRRRLARAGT